MKLHSVLLGTTLTMLLALHASTIDTLFPGIPDIRSEFAVGAGAGQLSMSAFVYAFAAVQLVYGPLSDRFGRRSVLLCAMSLFTLGALLASSPVRLKPLWPPAFFRESARAPLRPSRARSSVTSTARSAPGRS